MNDDTIINEQQQILQDIESWQYKDVDDLNEEKERISKIASYNLKKKKAISIRLIESDIQKIKAIAVSEGMPYQTLVSSVVHKFAQNRTI